MKKRHWTFGLRAIGSVVAIVLLIKMFLITSCFIPSSGMENSLYRGEGILVNKWSYGLRMPFPSIFGYHRIGKSAVEKGDIVLFNNPNPVNKNKGIERRELFISRCAGVPGDTLMLNGELSDVEGKPFSPDTKALYSYPASAEDSVAAILSEVGIEDNLLVGYTPEGNYIRSFSHYEYYLLSQHLINRNVRLFPLDKNVNGKSYPFIVPRKGMPVKVYPWNATLLCNTILFHEHRNAEVRNDTLFVDKHPVSAYTFNKDYYWVISNDPINLCDSRLFGFVPEDHLIGKASRIWFTSRKGRFMQRIK